MKNALRVFALSLVATRFTALAQQQGYKLTLTPLTYPPPQVNNDTYFETSSSCVFPSRNDNNSDGTINMSPNNANLIAYKMDVNYVRFNLGDKIRSHHLHPASHLTGGGGYPDAPPPPALDEVVERVDGCTGTKLNSPNSSVMHVLITIKKGLTSLRIYHYAERFFAGTNPNRHFEAFNVRTGQFQCAARSGGGWECDVSVSADIEYQHNDTGASETTALGTRNLIFHLKLEPVTF